MGAVRPGLEAGLPLHLLYFFRVTLPVVNEQARAQTPAIPLKIIPVLSPKQGQLPPIEQGHFYPMGKLPTWIGPGTLTGKDRQRGEKRVPQVLTSSSIAPSPHS